MQTTLRWTLAARGLAMLAFGVLVLLAAPSSAPALASLYAAYALALGAIGIVGALARFDAARAWLLLATGVVNAAIGAAVFLLPLEATALILAIAANEMLVGTSEIGLAVHRRDGNIEGEWLLVLAGCFSISAGFLLFAAGADIQAVAALIGVYAVVSGTLLLASCYRRQPREDAAPPVRDAEPSTPGS